MRCPSCGYLESKVVEEILVHACESNVGDFVEAGETGEHRRRECLACGARFTTYERLAVNAQAKKMKNDTSVLRAKITGNS